MYDSSLTFYKFSSCSSTRFPHILSDEDSSGVGKVVGIVFGVGAVIAIAAVGIWAVRGSLL